MRLSRNIFIKLLFIATILIAFYCIQNSSNGYLWNVNNVNETINNKFNKLSLIQIKSDENTELTTFINNDTYNVWCIFSKVSNNSPMKRKFKIFTKSLLKFSSVDITFHVITDEDSQKIANKTINDIIFTLNKPLKVEYYNVHKLASQLEDIVSVMSTKFSSKPGTYYSDALFFISLGLHRIAAPNQKLAVMLDADTKFRMDIKELFKEFDHFGEYALFGLAPELTPVYRHVLYVYRCQNQNTTFGEAFSEGKYPGYNSGVILFNLERLRNSLEYDQIVSQDMVHHLTEKYSFKGHLGDQDFYTILGMERPELIHTLDCGWNRQLCTWWRNRGYADVFNNYFKCNSTIKIWHGNCNTPIPDN